MGSYYTLGASIPVLQLGDDKLQLRLHDFVQELREQATVRDRQLIDLVLLAEDNKNLVAAMRRRERAGSILPSVYDPTVWDKVIGQITREQEEEYDPVYDTEYYDYSDLPKYLVDFVRDRISGRLDVEEYLLEDELHRRYLKYVQRQGDSFVKRWYDFNTEIVNFLAALTAKKFDLDYADFLIGDSELVQLLKSGAWAEINRLDESDLIEQLVKVSEESDPVSKERKIDALKWHFLDEATFVDTFSIDAMLAYLLKLQILERWLLLDKQHGARRFKELIMSLKKEGREGLHSFVEKTKK